MVGHGCGLFGIGNESIEAFIYPIEGKVFLIDFYAAVCGEIIDDDCPVVGVILHKDWV